MSSSKDDKQIGNYEGIKPHRCAARLNDFLRVVPEMFNISEYKRIASLTYKCFRSKEGEEPTEEYTYLTADEVKFYEEFKKQGLFPKQTFNVNYFKDKPEGKSKTRPSM